MSGGEQTFSFLQNRVMLEIKWSFFYCPSKMLFTDHHLRLQKLSSKELGVRFRG